MATKEEIITKAGNQITTINQNFSYLDTNKVDKVEGKGLSTNDFTNELKSKLDDLPASSGLSTVATSGDYGDLLNKPSIPDTQIQADWSQTDNTKLDYIKNKPSVISGQVQADWNESDNTKADYIKNKPSIPDAQIQADWSQTDNTKLDYIKNKPSVISGQVQADWNQTNTSEPDYIKNKPSVLSGQIQADWNQTNTSEVDFIKNKPTIPTVPTNVSSFTNDAGYLTSHQSLSNYYTKSEAEAYIDGLFANAIISLT